MVWDSGCKKVVVFLPVVLFVSFWAPGGALDEICAIGFRNPWRCSFDRANDNLYCGDVGHTFVEEIDLVE